jgi:hypothetical protein
VTRLLAGLLVVSFCGSAAVACGGGKTDAATAEGASVPPDVAEVSIFVVKDRSADSDPYVANAVSSVAQQLTRSGYRVVDNEKSADAFARVGVNKTEEQSLVAIQINGKTRVTYKLSVTVDLVDRDGAAVEKVAGDYSTSDGEADQEAVAAMVGKLSSSSRLAAYAKSSKEARAERAKREAGERQAAQAEQKTREERDAKEKQDADARKRAEGSLREASELKREIDQLRRSGEAAIPHEKLKALEASIESLKKNAPDSARYYGYFLTTYTLENAWWQSESDAPKTISTTLGSEVVTSGASDGKKLSVNFNMKAGHCYTALMRYKTTTGREEINEVAWSARGGNTPLQRYYYSRYSDEPDVQRMVGACATKDVPVTLTADLVFAGTKNALRYVVVGSPKAKFPLHLATYMSVSTADACDTDAWYQLWTDPIPGAVVYAGTEPFIVSSPDRAGDSWVTLLNATRGQPRAQKKELSSTPPKGIKFSTQFKFPGCSKERGEHADSIRFAKCHDQIDAKYKGQWDAAERARDNAITYLARRAAEASLNRINEADANDRQRTCQPIEDQIAKKWEQTFNKIVDFYTDTPHKSPIDRAGEMAAQSKR